MNWRKAIPAGLIVCTLLAVYMASQYGQRSAAGSAPNVVTADIQDGIENHIDEQTRLGGGFFTLPFDDGQLRLKLVRVHTEYLANLGPRRHFACVDLATADGDVYDVDFFLAGEPGAMTVTETTVHKVNGQPLYVWKQQRDKTWRRVPAENAAPELLGVLTGRDEFDFLYLATLPEMTENARMWIPLPTTDAFQTIEVKSIEAPGQRQILQEQEHGNKVQTAARPSRSAFTCSVLRKACTRPRRRPSSVISSRRVSCRTTRHSTASPSGSWKARRATSCGPAPCTTTSSSACAMQRLAPAGARATPSMPATPATATVRISTPTSSRWPGPSASPPASPSVRPSHRPGTTVGSTVDGYHCWAEFHTEGRWWPVDISEADKCAALGTYYFGHHPANRVEFTRGRDLVVQPGPASGPINFLAYPVLEIAGQPTKAKVTFSFTRSKVAAK